MSTIEVQACLARLYTDTTFRLLHYRDPKEALGRYFLTAGERQTIQNIDHDMLEFFASSLLMKRKKKLVPAFPALFSLDGPILGTFVNRYFEVYPLHPNGSHSREVSQFGEFMEETLQEADGLPPYASDLARFEHIASTLQLQVPARPSSAREDRPHRGIGTVGPSDHPALCSDVTVERFSYEVSKISEALLNNDSDPIASPHTEYLVWKRGGNSLEPRMFRISSPIAILLELCDGTRSLKDLVSNMEDRCAQQDLGQSITPAVIRLADLSILRITGT